VTPDTLRAHSYRLPDGSHGGAGGSSQLIKGRKAYLVTETVTAEAL